MRLFCKQQQLNVLLCLLLLLGCGSYEIDTKAVANITPNEAQTMTSENQAVIIDVREDNEWDEKHIPGAIHVPLGQLKDRITELETYKNTPLIMQCQRGGRSVQASAVMKSAGFAKVYNLDGGLQAWEQSGFKTE
jgi:rhodanese-related sulfurtransferase